MFRLNLRKDSSAKPTEGAAEMIYAETISSEDLAEKIQSVNCSGPGDQCCKCSKATGEYEQLKVELMRRLDMADSKMRDQYRKYAMSIKDEDIASELILLAQEKALSESSDTSPIGIKLEALRSELASRINNHKKLAEEKEKEIQKLISMHEDQVMRLTESRKYLR